MGLINNNSKDAQSASTTNTSISGTTHLNVIAEGTLIKGNIKAENDIRIDGEIEGKIDCKRKVTIGPSGSCNGDILCQNADIYGKLEGNINTEDTLTLKQTAKLNGDVKTQTLVIEPGATFTGSCSMGGKNIDDNSILASEE